MKKKTLFSALLSLFAICVIAQNKRVIDNPKFDVKTTGINNISRIELSDVDTRVYLHTTFIHNWWVKIESDSFIRPEGTSEKLMVTGIENGEFDKEIHMPESHDSTFVLIYPPLDKSVKKIDFVDSEKSIIYGISLTESQSEETAKNDVPAGVQKWLDDEVSKSKRKEAIDLNSDDFFQQGTSRLVGYMKGYDPRLGIEVGSVFVTNEMTREPSPIVMKINEDGSFEGDIPLQYPVMTYFVFGDAYYSIYLEPNTTLSMVIDWEEFLYADRWRNTRHKYKDIVFEGPTAPINRELSNISLKEYIWNDFNNDKNNLNPTDFKAKVTSLFDEDKKIIENANQTNSLSPQSLKILENTALLKYGFRLLDYEMNKSDSQGDDASDMLTDLYADGYYDFLVNIPWGDHTLLVSNDFSSFINRFEYNSDFIVASQEMYASLYKEPELSFNQYLVDVGVVLPEDDLELLALNDSLYSDNLSQEEKDNLIVSNESRFNAFNEKYAAEMMSYIEKYNPPVTNDQIYNLRNSMRDSVMINKFKVQPDLLYYITQTRLLGFQFEISDSKEEATKAMNSYESNVNHPILISEGRRLFDKAFPEDGGLTFNLPEGEPTEIFRRITDKYKGKYVHVDFWDIFCGPCISAIKNTKHLRDEYKDSEDIVFVFITSKTGSPLDRYTTFVEEQNMEHSYRLTDAEFKYMRQLFEFAGIPHYRTLDREGRVLKKSMHAINLEYELKKLLENQ